MWSRSDPGFCPALSLALFLSLGVFAPATASAAWLPLQVGNQWQYMDEGDEPHVEELTALGHLRGRRVHEKSYVGGIDDGLYNYWMAGPDGSVLLAGYFKPAYPFGLVYEPPIQIFPGLPALGVAWTTHTIAYSIPDNAFYAEFDLSWSVQEDRILQVPAGDFPCFGVGQVAPGPLWTVSPDVTLGLDGRVVTRASEPLDTGPTSATEWYADGVGLVQFHSASLNMLQSSNLPTPAAATTWGRIKRLYR